MGWKSSSPSFWKYPSRYWCGRSQQMKTHDISPVSGSAYSLSFPASFVRCKKSKRPLRAIPEDGPEIRPARESRMDRRYESTELTCSISSTVSLHGNLQDSNKGNGRGPGTGSPTALHTLGSIYQQILFSRGSLDARGIYPTTVTDGLCDFRYIPVPLTQPTYRIRVSSFSQEGKIA
jgi:hypothetical protein